MLSPMFRRIRLPSFVAVTLLVLVGLAGCQEPVRPAGVPPVAPQAGQTAPSHNPQPYVVLEPGWAYRFTMPGGLASRLEIHEPADLEDPVSGRQVRGYQMVWDDETIVVTTDQDWLLELGDIGEGGTLLYKTPKRHFPLYPKEGQTWTESFEEEFPGSGSFTYKVSGFETVETPAGRFDNTARVEVELDAPSGRDHWTEWYAPGVGLIKKSSGLELVKLEKPVSNH